ncbi:MAG: hypothetical protein FIB07_03185 [Candidatus Methanoperedens sp.]|nr:hypothetical protein [Candidatus Methanoperedens sp.]
MQSRNTIVTTVLIFLLLSVLPSGCLNSETSIKAIAKTSLDEHSPLWSQDGKFVFYIRETGKQDEKKEIWKGDTEGNSATFLTGVCCDVVFSSDRKDIFYIETNNSSEKEDRFVAYTMGVDGKNKKKIAQITLEKKYVGDGSTQGLMYDMHSWNPDRTKLFFTKMEETGYTWVWNEKERKWIRYKAGTEPSIPVVQEDTWNGQKLIAKEHERTAWVWDLKDNELRFVGHLSYGIVQYSAQEAVVWSPDGKYVALPSVELSEAGAAQQIFVINTENGESRRLTSFVGADAWPKWSDDSKNIMYLRMQPEYWWSPYLADNQKGFDIWMVDLDGSNEKQLTNLSNNSEEGWLSPDGSKVVYSSWKKAFLDADETQEIEIWIMNEDGNDRKLLTKVNTGGIDQMGWNPDGSKVAFVTWELGKDGLDRNIYVVDVSNEKWHEISSQPSTAPDISKIKINPIEYDKTKLLDYYLNYTTLEEKDICGRPGDPARAEDTGIVIRGTLKNEYDKDYYIFLSAEAYDSKENLLGRSLDSGPICGMIAPYVISNKTEKFELHLKYYETISKIKLFSGGISEIPPP